MGEGANWKQEAMKTEEDADTLRSKMRLIKHCNRAAHYSMAVFNAEGEKRIERMGLCRDELRMALDMLQHLGIEQENDN